MRMISKKRMMIDIIVLIVVLGGFAIYYFKFTPSGRLMTIGSQGFTYHEDSIFVDDNYQGSFDDTKKIINSAKQRVEGFFGELNATPTYIISNDTEKLEKLGWTGNPAFASTKVLLGVHTYVIITSDGMDLDIVAHEISHAELHSRLYEGKLFLLKPKVPVWFDEGVAIQNDYRSAYSLDAWLSITNNGVTIPPLSDIESPASFFNEDANIREDNYILSKYEIAGWLQQNGKDKLFELIEAVREGDSFETLYN